MLRVVEIYEKWKRKEEMIVGGNHFSSLNLWFFKKNWAKEGRVYKENKEIPFLKA